MAAEGLRLDSFYMASPVCSPSRGALLTGCYPPRIGFGDVRRAAGAVPRSAASGWPPSEVSLGRLLSDAGYRTAMIGKWHCGDQPAFLPTQPRVRLLLRAPVQQRHGPPGGHADRRARRPARLPAVAAAARRRRARAAARPGRRSPRATSTPPCASSASPTTARSSCTSPTCTCTCRSTSRSASRAASRNGAYGAAVETIDWVTAVILHELRASGLDESTIVVFTSDNGSRAATAAATPRFAAPRARRGTAACACRASCAGPVTSRPGRTSDELAYVARPVPDARRPLRRRRAGGPHDRRRRHLGAAARRAGHVPAGRVLVLLDERPRGRARRPLEAARRPGRRRRCTELYDVVADPGESLDRAAERPDEVARLDGDRRRGPSARSATPASASPAPTSARSAASPMPVPADDVRPGAPVLRGRVRPAARG